MIHRIEAEKIIFVFLVLACPFFSQNYLSIEEAIKTGLEKNLNVAVYKNLSEITKVQNNIGAAGMSPTITTSGGLSFSNLASHQEYITGVVQDRSGAQTKGFAGAFTGVWNVFDGFKMFAVRKRLTENINAGNFTLKQQMENTVSQIISAYYTISMLYALHKSTHENILVSEERRRTAQLKMDLGSGNRVDFLLAQSDENNLRSSLIDLDVQILNAKSGLNVLLNRPVDTDFAVSDSIPLNYFPEYENLKKNIRSNNNSILFSKSQESILSHSITEARAANIPSVQLQGSYNYNLSQSQAGLIALSRQSGINAGLNVNWLLYAGNRNRKLVEERSILLLNQRFVTQQTIEQVDAAVYVNYQTFLLCHKMLGLERINNRDAHEMVEIAMERYRQGKTGVLETIQSLQVLKDSDYKLVNLMYRLKLAETELRKSNGELVK